MKKTSKILAYITFVLIGFRAIYLFLEDVFFIAQADVKEGSFLYTIYTGGLNFFEHMGLPNQVIENDTITLLCNIYICVFTFISLYFFIKSNGRRAKMMLFSFCSLYAVSLFTKVFGFLPMIQSSTKLPSTDTVPYYLNILAAIFFVVFAITIYRPKIKAKSDDKPAEEEEKEQAQEKPA